MIKSLKVFCIVVLLSSSAFAQKPSEYSKTLLTMFEVSGSSEAYKTVIKQFIGMFKEQYTQVEEKVWDELEKEFSKTSLTDLSLMLESVYSKYMTKEDLEDLIEFYKTPVGKKFAKNGPLIMQESMAIGQQWGKKLGQDFAEKMKEKGY